MTAFTTAVNDLIAQSLTTIESLPSIERVFRSLETVNEDVANDHEEGESNERLEG